MTTKSLVTGGAGFIGSNLVDLLIKKKHKVIVLDNFSTGRKENLPPESDNFIIYNLDLTIPYKDWPVLRDIETLFHFAANADVRNGEKDRYIDFNEIYII